MGHCLEKKSYRYSPRPAPPAPPLKQYVIVMAIVGLFVPIFRAFYCTKWLGKKKWFKICAKFGPIRTGVLCPGYAKPVAIKHWRPLEATRICHVLNSRFLTPFFWLCGYQRKKGKGVNQLNSLHVALHLSTPSHPLHHLFSIYHLIVVLYRIRFCCCNSLHHVCMMYDLCVKPRLLQLLYLLLAATHNQIAPLGLQVGYNRGLFFV